ncbi:MAG TPA: efflux RND transporter periplasmic adaptor subunit [Gemmataceae bacterium]|nr:efflux RND transporter periplasmic adaptor subunit [Gemmataceae bacterium]
MKRVYVIAAVVILLAAAGAYGLYRWLTPSPNTLILPGIVEIQEVRLASKVGGRVAALHVREGDLVEKGQKLVTFEVPELEKQYAQQKAKVDQLYQEWQKAEYGPRAEEIAAAKAAAAKAKAMLDWKEAGYREEEKKQATSDLEAAVADAKQASEEFERMDRLYVQGSTSKSELDLARALRDRTQSKLSALKANVAMMEFGYRVEEKAAALREWEQAKANLDLLLAGTRNEDKLYAKARYEEALAKKEEFEVNLKEQTIYAPEKAFVEVIAVRPGDVVAANQPVIRVLRAKDIWIKVYVPETQISKIKDGTAVDVRIDAYPSEVFKGKVVQVGTISEFTPRNVQSIDERRFQVFPVKVQVEDPRDVFRAGLAAEVTIPLEGSPWR